MAESTTEKERKLLKAIQTGDIAKTKKLLKSDFTELNDQRYFDYYLIVIALSNSKVDLAKLLIEKGFRVYKKSQDRKTILEYAFHLGDTDLIKMLLEKGASPDILVYRNGCHKRLFHLAIDKNNLPVIELFLSHLDVKTCDKKNLFHYAIEKNKVEVVEQLAKKGLSLKKKNENMLTPVCIAIKNKKSTMLDCILLHCNVKNINLNNYDDIAPAYVACMTDNLQAIKKFIESGISINGPLKSTKDTWSCLNKYAGFTLLHCAVKHTKLKVVEFLLSKGADILVQNKTGSSPIHMAFEIKERGFWNTWQEFEDNNQIIDLLLKANMKLKSNPVNECGLSHFHVACSRDELKVVEHFLKLGVVINQPINSECHRYKGFSPLHFATKFRCKKTLGLLLKNGANVEQKDSKEMTALHIAAKESCLDGVRLLLQHGADITSKNAQGNSPVHLAFKKHNYAVIDLLLSIDNVAHSNPVNAKGLSHFHIACTRNNVNLVKQFIANGASIDTCVPAQSDEDKNTTDWSGYTPLHFAVSHNRSKIVELLLHSGANVEMKDSNGHKPFYTAYRYTFGMFREFIENNLYNLSKQGKITMELKPMTDIASVDENYFNGFNGTSIRINWTSNKTEHLKIISSLLKFENDVNYVDNEGNALIFYAYIADTKLQSTLENNLNCSKTLWNQVVRDLSEEMSKRKKFILNDLLKRKVNLEKCYKNGSILHYICSREEKRDSEMLELFLKAGTNVNVRNDEMSTPLHQATSRANKNVVSILLDYDAEVDCIRPRDNSTPLLIICSNDRFYLREVVPIMKVLIDKGANVNASQSDGRTPLHHVASIHKTLCFGRSKFDARISLLVQAGANVHIRDSNGFTPLRVACSSKNYRIVDGLLKAGADVNMEDNEGRTAICYMYEKHLKQYSSNDIYYMREQIIILQNHIYKMKVIGLPIGTKTLASHAKCNNILLRSQEDQSEFIGKCKSELQLLKDTNINPNCTLHNMIFRNVNALSQLVKNRTFKSIVQSKTINETYPNYGYLIQLKYQEGLVRGDILLTAKCLLNNLIGLDLPDMCSEHIFAYFTNVELKESIETLSSFVDCSVAKPKDDNNMQLRTRKATKRQKVN